MNRPNTENYLQYASISIAHNSNKLDYFGISSTSTFLKRAIDVVLSFAILAFSAPFLVIIAIVIKLSRYGTIIFSQKRVGQNGEIFRLYKFRTLYDNADPYAITPTKDSDPRITPVGKFLRDTGLDELPQLINVLRGEMSIVGPRPEMEFIVRNYSLFEKTRLLVKPGVTGLWQLHADRTKPIHENLDYDLHYIENYSLFLDFTLIMETALFILKKIIKF
ncbi:MAG: sugar transferase [Candidatus Moranbacteria bacterium]|nr:sugar transferase [Candidatus Moranbacteria bacterium]